MIKLKEFLKKSSYISKMLYDALMKTFKDINIDINKAFIIGWDNKNATVLILEDESSGIFLYIISLTLDKDKNIIVTRLNSSKLLEILYPLNIYLNHEEESNLILKFTRTDGDEIEVKKLDSKCPNCGQGICTDKVSTKAKITSIQKDKYIISFKKEQNNEPN